jgi:putative spermidine/putrescine transport system substrate-binding protein
MTRRRLVTRRKALALGAGSIFAPYIWPAGAQTRTVYVNSYGGVWETSWKKAFFDPFTAQTGIQIKTVPGVSFAKLKAQVQTRNYEWDVINIGDVEYGQAVLEGLLEKVDPEAAKIRELPPNMVREYGITSYSLGTNIVYRKDRFPNGGPQNWADFWDVQKFPGARCLYDRSFSCLAFATLADGVPAEKLYPMDIDRAFRKMSELKPHIRTWWRDGSQSQQLIRDGEVDMIAMWSARGVDLIEDKVPLELVWNGAEIYYANLLVPKGNPRAKLAWEFCNFVAQAKPQAEFAMLLPYGPANPDARALMTEARLKQTPAWPENEKVSFRHDAAWIAPKLAQIRERWTRWLTT